MATLDMSPAAARADVPRRIAALREAWLAEWAPKLENNAAPINPYRVVAELNRLVDQAEDHHHPRRRQSARPDDPVLGSIAPLTYIGWGKTTQLGYGLGLAMGAKLAKPDHLCINVWGDAAIGFTGMDLETAVRERIPILSILFNNFSMAIEIPIMPVSQASTARPTFPATTPTWPRRSAAMASGSPTRATSSRP